MISAHDLVERGSARSAAETDAIQRFIELIFDGVSSHEAQRQLARDAIHLSNDTAAAVVRSPLIAKALVSITRLRCRDWLLRCLRDVSSVDPEFMLLQDATGCSRETFLRDYYSRNRPALFPGLAKNWPATRLWSPEYLSQACGDAIVEIMSGRDRVHASRQNVDDALRRSVPFSEYISRVYFGEKGNDVYLVSRNRFFAIPETRRLLADVGEIPYVSAGDPAETVRLWFGPGGTETSLHYDDVNQFVVVVGGSKSFRLYSPLLGEFMEQVREWYAEADPRMDGCASAIPEIECILNPGDALFLPVGWWHAVEAREPTIMLTFRQFGVVNTFERPR